MTRVRQAVVLVGGLGTRLGALTRTVPKPLLEIAPGVVFLDRLLDEIERHAFDDILLLAGHLGEQVAARYDGRRLRRASIRVLREPAPLGTAGALRHARPLLAPRFLMANGDTLFAIDLRALTAPPLGGALGRLALRGIDDVGRYGAVETAGDRVTGFREKAPGAVGPGVISGGVYLLDRAALDGLPDGPCSIEADVFPRLAAEGRLEGRRFDGYFLDIGLPETFAQACRELAARRARPAVFFDRDGVLNHDLGYTHRLEDLRWIDGAREAVRSVNASGRLAIVVTNQAGVARGLYTEADVDLFHDGMQDALAEVGAHLDAVYHCPFHPEATVETYRRVNHEWRKPRPGMILQAFEDWPIREQNSVLIGDRETDIRAAEAAGIRAVLYRGGNLADVTRQAMAEAAEG